MCMNNTTRTIAELTYIANDARDAAALADEMGNDAASARYLDEMADALTELNRRRAAAAD